MKKTLGISILAGLAVGLVAGLLLQTVTAIDNMIVKIYLPALVGAISGGVAVYISQKRK